MRCDCCEKVHDGLCVMMLQRAKRDLEELGPPPGYEDLGEPKTDGLEEMWDAS
jgi:hypothetical protein